MQFKFTSRHTGSPDGSVGSVEFESLEDESDEAESDEAESDEAESDDAESEEVESEEDESEETESESPALPKRASPGVQFCMTPSITSTGGMMPVSNPPTLDEASP